MVISEYYDLVKDEYTVGDNVETVTITPWASGRPLGDAITTVKAKEIAFELSELATYAANINLESIHKVFEVYDVTLGGEEIRNGYLLTHNGTIYSIEHNTRVGFDSKWHCACRRQKGQ